MEVQVPGPPSRGGPDTVLQAVVGSDTDTQLGDRGLKVGQRGGRSGA